MAEGSKIEWTDHTFNPWTGCTKISPACDNCYAESWAKRSGLVEWGPHAERRRTSANYWEQPLKWNARAEREGRRFKVFCASLADVFDNQVPEKWRADLWGLISATPHLDWLLLTKRPQNIAKMLPSIWNARHGWFNVWLGTTVENQEEADRRIPSLLAVGARKRFLSCEPLLGPVNLTRIEVERRYGTGFRHTLTGELFDHYGHKLPGINSDAVIDWVIAGGESGANARPMHPDWARSLRDQCQEAGVPFFFKQWGQWGPIDHSQAADESVWQGKGRFAVLRHNGTIRKADGSWPSADAGEVGIVRIGKNAAGAVLDDREWREFPNA